MLKLFGYIVLGLVSITVCSPTLFGQPSQFRDEFTRIVRSSAEYTINNYRHYYSVHEIADSKNDALSNNFDQYSEQIWEKLPVYGADVNDILIDPDGYIYTSTFTGVFRSTDNGNSWEEKNNGLKASTAFSMVYSSDGTLFLGNVNDVYYSTDSGDSWYPTFLGPSANIVSLAIDSNDILYAGSSFGTIHKSTDLGLTWTDISISQSANFVYTLKPISNSLLLASPIEKGVYYSTNNGSSWNETNLTEGTFTNFIQKINGDIYTGGASLSPEYKGVFRSTDNGITWERLVNQISDLDVTSITKNSSDYLFVTTQDVENNIKVFRTSDSGNNWVDVTNNLQIDFGIDCITIDSKDNIFIGSVGNGVFNSTNNGDDWNIINNNLTGFNVESFEVTEQGYIFIAATASGIFRSIDNGLTFQPVNSGLETAAVLDLVSITDSTLIAAASNGIYRSNDFGSNWTQINSGIPEGIGFSSIEFDINNDKLFAGSFNDGVYQSLDDGQSWISINEGLFDLNTVALSVSPNGNVFVSTLFSGIFKLEFGSQSWKQVNNGLQQPVPIVRDISVHPFTNNIYSVILFRGLYQSTDNGELWTQTSLTEPLLTQIKINESEHLFASVGVFGETRSNDVYRSTNEGSSWVSIKMGIQTENPITAIKTIESRSLLTGTWAAGVYLWTDLVSSVNDPSSVPADFILYQNYPNPFNPSTEIKYLLPSENFVELIVFNSLGQKISTFVNEYRLAGKYTVEFNAEGLPSGVYFYQIKTQKHSQTKKMVFIK